MMSGTTSACSQANSVPVRPKPTAISSNINNKSNRRAVAATRASVSGEWNRMPPAAWTSGSMITAVSSCACAATVRSKSRVDAASLRQRCEELLRQHGAKQPVHAFLRIADGHRGEGVAVVTAAKAQEPRPPRLAAVQAILQGHLHRNLDGDRARLREEHVREIAGQNACEPRRQRIGRRMREPAEHHVRHARELRGDGGADVRMVVAVAGGPPRRDAIDELAAVGEIKPYSVRALDDERRRRGFHLPIRQPQMTQTRHTRR